jgi:hypothetical protein
MVEKKIQAFLLKVFRNYLTATFREKKENIYKSITLSSMINYPLKSILTHLQNPEEKAQVV